MAGPVWRGAVSFGLVSVPVQLLPVVRSRTIRFRQLHAKTSTPIVQRRIDPTTGEEVTSKDLVKGYEVADGQFVVVSAEELEALEPATSRLIEIRDYVDQAEIDPIYYDRAYYLAPDGPIAAKPYRLLATAMERAGKVGIASFVLRGRAYLAALRSRDGLLLLSTMHYADEVADPEEVDLELDAPLADRELAMAEALIDSLVTDFDPESYCDEHRERLLELLEAKAEAAGLELSSGRGRPRPGELGDNVVDLVAALERSLEQGRPTPPGGGGGAPRRGGGRRPPDAGGLRGTRGPAATDYASLSRERLYELARERDLPGRSRLTKAELVDALTADDRASGAA